MKKYIVQYRTRSGKYNRDITFKSYNKALSLYNALERDEKYLTGVDEKGVYHVLKRYGKTTYTIYIDANNLTWDIIHKADEIGGMIEQVLDNLIAWHELEENEIEPSLEFIRETWGHISVELHKEFYSGKYKSFCSTQFEKKIDL